MIRNTTICILILTLFLLGIVSGRSCNCRHANSRADNAQKALNKANRINNDFRGKNIALGTDFALSVSNNGKTIGYIYHQFSPDMTLPPNTQIDVIVKPNVNTDNVRIYYDVNHWGLFAELSIPGNYTASQISLPKNSISSIEIPDGFQAILYAGDNFQGDHILVTGSNANLGAFNDKTQSIEIRKLFTKMPEHLAVAYSYPNHIGKQHGLVLGNNTITSSQIKSIVIHSEYEVLIYSDDVLIDVIHSTSRNLQLIHPNKIFNAIVQKISDPPNEYVVFYEDTDFNGPQFILFPKPTHSVAHANGKLSSMRIPPGYEVVLYDKPDFQGAYLVVSGNVNNLNFYAFNDRAMSIFVRPKNGENSYENVAIYTKSHYDGEKMTLPIGLSECSSSVKLLNFCYDVFAASIKVPSGFKVTLAKAPTPITRNERIYTYVADSPEIRNYIDTHIVSVLVEKI